MCKAKFVKAVLSFLACSAVMFLAANRASAVACGQVLAGCNNNVFVGIRVCPSSFTHVGDRVGFTVRFFNNDPNACDITNANITLHLPDGRNILVLSNACILSPSSAPPNGDAFDCPGTDPRCVDNNPADYTVLVTPAMLVHGVSGCPPVVGTDPNTPVIIFAFTTGAGTAVGSPIPDNINGCTTTGLGVIQPCVSCAKSCTNAIGANGLIGFGGSVLNCTPVVNTNVPSLSALTITINDVAAGQTNAVFFVGTTNNTIILNPGQTAQFAGFYAPADVCVPSTDTIIVVGQDSQVGCAGGDAVKFGTNVTTGISPRSFVTNTCSATCSNVITPCITVGKLCGPATVNLAAGSYQVSGAVTNCGNITLTNVTVIDTITNISGVVSTISIPIGTLTNGQIANVPTQTISFSTAGPCGPISDFFTVTGSSCKGTVTNHSPTCTTTVICPPKICVTKQIACATGPFGSCGNFGPSAIGVRGDTLAPTFCYLITVTNCGLVDLTNVSVVDSIYGNLTSHFPCVTNTLEPGGVLGFQVGAGCSYVFDATITTPNNTVTNVTNIVQAAGFSVASGQFTNAFAQALATVVPASVVCTKQYSIDGGPLTNNVTITDGAIHTIAWYATIQNTGLANLLNVRVTDTGLTCTQTNIVTRLDAGTTSAPVPLCTNTVACTIGNISDTVTIFANQFDYTSNHIALCSVNATATASTNISVGSTCSAALTNICPPKICVTKQIACATGPFGSCGTFGPSAIGVRGDTLAPTFCYFITVTNCGQVDLTNVSVVDTIYGNLTSHFPCVTNTLEPGGVLGFKVGAGCTYVFDATITTPNNVVTSVTNVVQAAGNSVATGQFTNAFAQAIATVVPASVVCTKQYTIDGGPLTNNVTITDGAIHTITWYATLRNTGLANLLNVQVTDVGLTCTATITVARLDAGATSAPVPLCTNSVACTIGNISDTVTIFANQFDYTSNHLALCSVNATATSSTNISVGSTCSAALTNICPPKICVTKQIACATGPFGSCGTFGPSAIGVQGDNNVAPTFCYFITVTNCGQVDLTNVSVIDTIYGDLTSHFPCVTGTVEPGGVLGFRAGAGCTYVFDATIGTTGNTITVQTNVVTATGYSVATGQQTNAQAQAVATVVPASVVCTKQYTIDGGPLTNNVTLRDGATHSVVWYVTLQNTGLANLLNVRVTDAGLTCTQTNTVARLDAGTTSAPIPLCTNSVPCGSGTISDTVTIFANQFDYTSNHIAVCSVHATATASTNISVGSTCSASLTSICLPKICVTKQIACATGPFGSCGTFGPSAIGVQGDNNVAPTFCYLITVTNCGPVDLTNVSVIDTIYGDLTSHFPCVTATVEPGGVLGFRSGAGCSYVFDATISTTDNTVTVQTNVVTATGYSVATGQQTNAQAQAVATVVPASVVCTKQYRIDDGPLTNNVTLTDGVNHTVVWYATLQNTGLANLLNVKVTDTGLTCTQTNTVARLDAGATSAPIPLCTNIVPCTSGNISDTVTIFANQFDYTSNHIAVCSVHATATASTNISVGSTCSASLTSICPPKICVTKQIACATGPFGSCGTFGPSAIGVQGDTLAPTFCYLITVTNCSQVDLTNVSVIDTIYGDLTAHFPCVTATVETGGVLGFKAGTGCSYLFDETISTTDNTITVLTNVVTATGYSVATGQPTNAQAQAVATVVPASVVCTKQYSIDGGPLTNNVSLTDGANHTVVWSVTIQNTGKANLLNVQITDIGLTCTNTVTVSRLDAGATSTPIFLCDGTFACSVGSITNTVSIFANQYDYTSNHLAVCSVNATATASTNVSVGSTCSAALTATCPPKICVTKQIACFLGNNTVSADAIHIEPITNSALCGTFGKSAVGVQGDTLSPSFCYLITVTNCGLVGLTSVTVTDSVYGDLTAHFPCAGGVLNPGDGCSFIFEATLSTPDNTITVVTNTVTAIGCSVVQPNVCTNASDIAVATIVPASVACEKYYTIDGGPPTNDVTIGDSATHTIVWYVTVTNTGKANLTDATMTDVGLGCPVNVTFSLDAGAIMTFIVCTNASFACTNGEAGITNEVTVFANHFTYTTNHTPVCEISGNSTASTNVFVQTMCEAELMCSVPTSCRVTGGGRQDLSDPAGSVCPDDARFVTHGGQVGAPVGNMICSIDTSLPNYFLGNPCIHGRWTHVRHGFGGNANEGNFHARFFDTLDCACLDTNLDTTICQYGPGTTSGKVCNPGDRLAGPEPRKAGANKIAFTGVGDWQCEKGGRERRACLFRVDIEDRGEPGNAHALSRNDKAGREPDRYRIRIWVLTQAELDELEHGTGPDPYLIHFRDCISACHGIDYRDGGVVGFCGQPNNCNGDTCNGANTTGTIVFPGGCPVRTPNIDDGGEMLHGNHQIHPQIKGCDPANPTGPGLANPKL